jgi:Family of unknown function (DUF6551)
VAIKQPKTAWVAADDVGVFEDGQRSLRPHHVAKLVAAFCWEMLGAILVSKRKAGKYFVIDGQHRLEAVRQVGLGSKKIRCEMYEGLTPDEEAALFVATNGPRLGVRPFDLFKARVTAKEPIAVAIKRVVSDLGIRISDEKLPGAISAVAAIEKVYTGKTLRVPGEHGDLLRRTLRLLRDAWGEELGAFDGVIIEGLGAMLLRYGEEVQDERLLNKMTSANGGARGLLRRAKNRRDDDGGSLRNAVACQFVKLHNLKLRKEKLAPWDR